jgi:hypothetical protein
LQEWKGGLKGIILILGGSDALTDFVVNQHEAKSELTSGIFNLPEGMTAQEAVQRLKLTFSRGILSAALDAHACVVTCGSDTGAIGLLGRANKDRSYKVPLIIIINIALQLEGLPRSWSTNRALIFVKLFS